MSGTYHRNTNGLSKAHLQAIIVYLENKLRYKHDRTRIVLKQQDIEIKRLTADVEYWQDKYSGQCSINKRLRGELDRYKAA
jgi:hypothetical protein